MYTYTECDLLYTVVCQECYSLRVMNRVSSSLAQTVMAQFLLRIVPFVSQPFSLFQLLSSSHSDKLLKAIFTKKLESQSACSLIYPADRAGSFEVQRVHSVKDLLKCIFRKGILTPMQDVEAKDMVTVGLSDLAIRSSTPDSDRSCC